MKFGAEARIVLDAYPKVAIPAKVSFIATQAQFTPKTVETQNERDKLMFRIRVRSTPIGCAGGPKSVRSGLPGVAYIRPTAAVAWPGRAAGVCRRNDGAAMPVAQLDNVTQRYGRVSGPRRRYSSYCRPAAWSG